jgi:hypothetical protein
MLYTLLNYEGRKMKGAEHRETKNHAVHAYIHCWSDGPCKLKLTFSSQKKNTLLPTVILLLRLHQQSDIKTLCWEVSVRTEEGIRLSATHLFLVDLSTNRTSSIHETMLNAKLSNTLE